MNGKAQSRVRLRNESLMHHSFNLQCNPSQMQALHHRRIQFILNYRQEPRLPINNPRSSTRGIVLLGKALKEGHIVTHPAAHHRQNL